MFDWLGSLLDTDGYVPRAACGNWTPGWIAVHTGSDVLIWLAYLSIPLVLLAVARHPAVRPLRPLVLLFAAFIVACGTTHLIDSLMFRWPLYRLSGAAKLLTAAVSWATVFALVPAVRRLVRMLDALPSDPPPAAPRAPGAADADPPELVYALAILVAVLAVLVRYALDPILGDLHPFSVCLLGVTFLAWYGGYGPALVALLVSGTASLYLFIPLRQSFAVEGLSHQFGVGVFLFTALGVMVLGEVQRATRRRLQAKVAQLREATAALQAEKQKVEAALGQLDALVRNAPCGIAYFDADLKYIRVNDTFATTHNVKLDGNADRPLTEILQLPADLLGDFRHTIASGDPVRNRLVAGAGLVWEVTAFPVPMADGRRGLGVIGLDVTDRQRAADRIAESEARFRNLAEAMPQFVWTTRPDGEVDYFNSRWYEYTGLTPADTLGTAWATPLHPDDAERARATWARCVTTGLPYQIEYRFRRSDGAYEWFLGRGVPVRDADGRVVRWLGTCTNIDDRVRAADALRDSEARFRELADAMPQIVYATDPTGRVEYINRRWSEATGQRAADAADNTGLIHPDDVPTMQARWRVAGEAGTPFECEFRLKVVPDGAFRWFLARSIPIRDPDGRVVRWYGTSTDIDDQKRLQDNLREAALQQRQLTEGMPLLMWACTPDGYCDYLSRQWLDYTGTEHADQVGGGWLACLHPDDRRHTTAAWRAAVADGTEYELEYRLRRYDGVYRWFAVRGIPLRDQSGRIVRWFGGSTDIDDRKRRAETLERLVAERTAELGEKQVFLDAILDNVAEGVVACGPDGQLKLFNAVARRWHGLPAEPLPADRWAERYGLFEQDGVTPLPLDRLPLARAWRGEAVTDAEMVIRAVGQPDRYLLASGHQLRGPHGGVFGAVVSMRDMTERREYERQLLLTTAALRTSNEDLEKFAYIASHDLQEPLRKVQAFGTRLADKFRDAVGDQGKDYIDRMLDSATRMRKLIDDLLAFSRVTTNPVPFAAVDLNEVARDVLHVLDLRLQQTGGRVFVAPLPTLPGDASQLRQVFQNLIGNALKFARPGVPPEVRIAATPFTDLPPADDPPPGPGWRIAVTDKGIGFEQEYAGRIFELFQRLHARTEYDGTGLGLAIVRKIILRHGATIAARSRPNEGAAFVIDWPTRTVPPT